MTWREDLRRVTLPDDRRLIGASFRGATFFVDSGDRSGGRRAVVHEFPLRDDPFVEDLGRKARSFRVDGYVIGDDYLTQRDSLLAALEDTEGPGELMHPYHGVLRAIAVSYSVRESKGDGGMATFSIEFAETPTQAPVPTEVVDATEQVSDSADAAITATKAEFAERYDDEDMPSYAFGSAVTALSSASEALGDALAPITTTTQELASLTATIEQLKTQAVSLVRQPDAVLDAFRASITGLIETAASAPLAVIDALADSYLADLGALIISATTPIREREQTNQTAMIGALRQVIAVEAARLTPLVPYESIEQATATRDKVVAMLEEQAGLAGDTAYPALVDLHSEVLSAVPGDNQFASIVTVTRNVPIPSLLLAYQLYGSVDLEADIIARNSIRHPGFVSGDLKVLSDG